MTPPRIVVLTGATASGKSSLALELAEAIGGEIVNSDSVQVYKGFDIGSGKPSVQEQQRVPHHLFSVQEPSEAFDVAQYLQKARAIVSEILERGAVPILVGGTGLYVQSMLCGLVAIDEIAPEIIQEVEAREASFLEDANGLDPNESMHDWLRSLDPERAEALHPSDRHRVRRALYVALSTGERISSLQREHGFAEPLFTALVLHLEVQRETLYDRINARVDEMFNMGLLSEVKTLLEKYEASSPPFGAIGYRHVCEHLRGEIELEAMIELMKRDTRRFAKRQLTWWRNQPKKLGWMLRDAEQISSSNPLVSLVRGFVDKKERFVQEGIAFLPISLEDTALNNDVRGQNAAKTM